MSVNLNCKIINEKTKFSLVLITDPTKNQILLGMKKRGFGMNKWHGFGGKLDLNETIEQCAKREVFEECSLNLKNLRKFAILSFISDNGILREVHLFKTSSFTGEIKESEEMVPKWFNISELPFESMLDDYKYWMNYFLDNQEFNGFFKTDVNSNIICLKINILNNQILKPIEI